MFYILIKTITKIGNSKGISFDAALLELADLKEGDKVYVTIHDGGTITLTPDRKTIDPDSAREQAKQLIKKNDELFHRLAQ